MTTDWSRVQAINFERLNLFQQLHIYGDVIPLKPFVDPERVKLELESLSHAWVQYNPSKSQNPRWGLSVTSLDGGMSGVPDLYSLYEWSRETGNKVSEKDFNKTTEAFRKCTAIHELVAPFQENLGRCRFVKFKSGGHFPPHRDGSVSFQVPDYFRILVPLANTAADDFHFVHDGRLIALEPGRPYLFNALKTHSVVSYSDDAMTLALSVALNQEMVANAIRLFKIY